MLFILRKLTPGTHRDAECTKNERRDATSWPKPHFCCINTLGIILPKRIEIPFSVENNTGNRTTAATVTE